MSRQVFINGIPVTLLDDEEMAKCDAEFVVCCTSTMARHTKVTIDGTCKICGVGIFHSPEIPKDIPTICIYCARKMSSEEKSQ